MFTGTYRRVYHFHIRKCGGSTFNHWLDTLTFDERAFRPRVWSGYSAGGANSEEMGGTSGVFNRPLAEAFFHWSDVVYSHGPLRRYVPEHTFCLTMLRDPVRRLVSQIADWRRLSDTDTIDSPAGVRDCVKDTRRLCLRDLLEKHALRGGRKLLDNHMTRALAAAGTGSAIDGVTDPDRLRDVALQSLERDYDLIGLTAEMDLSRNALCAMVGLPPARAIPKINVTRPADHPDLEPHDLPDIVTHLTRVDRVIYDRARQLFNQRHRPVAEAYDTAMFEARHAGRLVAEARGYFCDGATRFSVRAPIIGSGFHGRDGSGMASCAVWSGPETRTTLYMPTPPNMALSLLVWVRGYADIRQRRQLRVRVDGSPAAHRFESAQDYADLLAIDACPTRNFVRLEIDIDETLESGDPASNVYDSRQRGFAFDSYGWRPIQ